MVKTFGLPLFLNMFSNPAMYNRTVKCVEKFCSQLRHTVRAFVEPSGVDHLNR
jgi:hypothetical protein